MRAFKDTEGREWLLKVDVSAVRRVRTLANVDIAGLGEEPANLGDVLRDPVKLCDVLYVLCKQQADDRKVTDEQFGESLGGDVLEQASAMFVEALIDFFPKRQGKLLAALWAKNRELETVLESRALEKIAGLDLQKFARDLMPSSTDSLESSV